MILATHAVTGAALASLMPTHPALAFAAGFASHFALDAIPHWDYKLHADLELGRGLWKTDLIKIGIDGVAGLILGWMLFGSPIAIIGAIGAMFPDALQFAYFKLRGPILTPLQHFHQWIHTNYRIKNRPALGLSLQILFVIIIIQLTAALQSLPASYFISCSIASISFLI